MIGVVSQADPERPIGPMGLDEASLRRRVVELASDVASSRHESDELRAENERLRQLLSLGREERSELHRASPPSL